MEIELLILFLKDNGFKSDSLINEISYDSQGNLTTKWYKTKESVEITSSFFLINEIIHWLESKSDIGDKCFREMKRLRQDYEIKEDNGN